uniref:MBD domain-containing protein n=1 Tax=Macrostomum lignano TaxID=282301 RepID=A0A1I8GBC3_9PLAT
QRAGRVRTVRRRSACGSVAQRRLKCGLQLPQALQQQSLGAAGGIRTRRLPHQLLHGSRPSCQRHLPFERLRSAGGERQSTERLAVPPTGGLHRRRLDGAQPAAAADIGDSVPAEALSVAYQPDSIYSRAQQQLGKRDYGRRSGVPASEQHRGSEVLAKQPFCGRVRQLLDGDMRTRPSVELRWLHELPADRLSGQPIWCRDRSQRACRSSERHNYDWRGGWPVFYRRPGGVRVSGERLVFGLCTPQLHSGTEFHRCLAAKYWPAVLP